jgi:release factor glutamine methyltransferase
MKGLKDNTLFSLWKWFFESLQSFYDENELKSIRKIFFEHFFGITDTDLLLRKESRYTETDIVTLIKGINKLKQHIPIQYITKKAFFFNYVLKVSPDVLIPRPETEELVLKAVGEITKSFGNKPIVRVLDIGTGSGCIAISIADQLKQTQVSAIDISEKALAIARENALKYNANINFQIVDILEKTDFSETFDIIISNPPYVRESEKSLMHKNVLEYEPDSALYVDDSNALVFYNEICNKATNGWLNEKGILCFEINEFLGNEMISLLKNNGFRDIRLEKDFRGKDRFIIAYL